ncbi:TAT-binding protein-like protein 7, AAA ATPase [Entomophthora muscae]|uniref:TAT-binding protein-like protein 7, AAA ATPase n=1 Tax=Entomophthora muscae TaxID=34485 RepID=A0ACC2UBM5_9FUNG|nr:TAT-binding protein-like protein 7, AAA ATPase [Entomophthora muscae]
MAKPRRRNAGKRVDIPSTDVIRPRRACTSNITYTYNPPDELRNLRKLSRPSSCTPKKPQPLKKDISLRALNKIDYAEEGSSESSPSPDSPEAADLPSVEPLLSRPFTRSSKAALASTPEKAPKVSTPKPRAKRLRFAESENNSEEEFQASMSTRRKLTRFRADSSEDMEQDGGRYPKRKSRPTSYTHFFSTTNFFASVLRNGTTSEGSQVPKYNFRETNKETRAKLSSLYNLPEPIFDDPIPLPRPKAKVNGGDDTEDTDDNLVLLPINYAEIYESRPSIVLPNVPPVSTPVKKTTIVDIGGLDEQIQTIKEALLLPNMYPEFTNKYNIAPVRGILFHGPPGTGKTMTAQALVAECSRGKTPIAFFHVNANDILSKWVGKSEAKIRSIFTAARLWQPSIVFIDEIDGITPPRSSSDRHNASLVASFLSQMDGIDNSGQVLVIGATNRLHAIDPALQRSGRFEEALYFPLPDLIARKAILNITAARHGLTEIELSELAGLTSGYSGADLSSLVGRAGKLALFRTFPLAASVTIPKENYDDIQICINDFKQAILQITPTSKLLNNIVNSPLPPHLEKFSPKVDKAVQALQNTGPSYPAPFFLPHVLVIKGEDEITKAHIASAILHGLDSHKVSPLDIGLVSTSDDSSDLKALKLKLNNLSPNGQRGIALIKHADIFAEAISPGLLTTLCAALNLPGYYGEKSFIFITSSLTPELKGLFSGLKVMLIDSDNP